MEMESQDLRRIILHAISVGFSSTITICKVCKRVLLMRAKKENLQNQKMDKPSVTLCGDGPVRRLLSALFKTHAIMRTPRGQYVLAEEGIREHKSPWTNSQIYLQILNEIVQEVPKDSLDGSLLAGELERIRKEQDLRQELEKGLDDIHLLGPYPRKDDTKAKWLLTIKTKTENLIDTNNFFSKCPLVLAQIRKGELHVEADEKLTKYPQDLREICGNH